MTSTDKAFCYYSHSVQNNASYGVLYNWLVVMNGSVSSSGRSRGVHGICPEGWYIPSDVGRDEFVNYLGGESLTTGSTAYYRFIAYDKSRIGKNEVSKKLGMWIRCIKD
ncbi:hypothetical protein EYV94_08045 [Puteibacter caeruleilacunae]|nr:hypothetical protein EYV94_08045 [Puteibacter caeruleilacunae]